MKLFNSLGTLIVAEDKSDATRIMREEWGEAFPVKEVRKSVLMTTNGEDTITMTPSEVVKSCPRGIIPEP